MEFQYPSVTPLRVEKGDGLTYWVPLVGDLLEPDQDVADFMQHLAVTGRSENTTKSYASWLAPAIRYRVAHDWTWSDLADHMDEFLIWRRQQRRTSNGRGAKGPSTETMRLMVTAMNQFYRFLIANNKVESPERTYRQLFALEADLKTSNSSDGDAYPLWAAGNPRYGRVKGVPDADIDLQRRRALPKAVTTAEFNAMMSATKSRRDAFILMLLGGAGLRVGAVASLRRESIHGKNTRCEHSALGPHIHVNPEPTHPHHDSVKSPAVVPVAMDVMQWYWAWLEDRRDVPGAANQPWLLVTLPNPGRPGGEPLASDAIRVMVDRVAQAAGISRKITPHMLRHFVGQSAADMGLPADQVQKILGHRSITSQEVYRNASAEAARRGVDALAQIRSTP